MTLSYDEKPRMNENTGKWLKVYLKCFINAVLDFRNVYPQESFDWTTYQAFNLPRHIPINRHPQVSQYIETLIEDLLSKLGNIRTFNLNIVRCDDRACIENYAIDFSELRHWDTELVSETEVFDELRSSLNGLLSQLEKLPKIKPGTVTFEIIIEGPDLNLGREAGRVLNETEKRHLEQNVNWTKTGENQFQGKITNSELGNEIQGFGPKVKLTSIAGCDSGPIVFYVYTQRIIAPKDSQLLDIYESYSQEEFQLSLP
ncbi:LAMI_0C10484g1_1 [Lachancea mirantina]|uniref:LAMI_0C10484g1_1 n=1 Tax=Lachancea mirantina TaxID=1230905 RepID=A0A1G4J6L0_9SACH|nr:LAMI_0C10484g1_1 [Lachancea mirantina]